MAKEKVFIVLSHKHSLKKDPKSGKSISGEWEVSETVEFVNQLRDKHTYTSTAVADFLNKKMLSGSRYGMTDFPAFIEYLNKKYKKQMDELNSKYGEKIESTPDIESKSELITDQFGNVRLKTVFDTI